MDVCPPAAVRPSVDAFLSVNVCVSPEVKILDDVAVAAVPVDVADGTEDP